MSRLQMLYLINNIEIIFYYNIKMADLRPRRRQMPKHGGRSMSNKGTSNQIKAETLGDYLSNAYSR